MLSFHFCNPVNFHVEVYEGTPQPLNIDSNLLHTSSIFPVDVTVSVSSSKSSATSILGIAVVASGAALSVLQLGHPNYPLPIFNNNIPASDSYGTDILPTHNTNGDHGLQLQLHHQKLKRYKYVYTTSPLRQIRGSK